MAIRVKIKQVFEASDGSVWYTEEEALSREKFIELEQWYAKNRLFGNYAGSQVYWEDLLGWCSDNKEKLLEILKFC